MTPIEMLLKSHGDENLEWQWQAPPGQQPVFIVRDELEVTPVNLRDWPQFYEEIPGRIFRFTAEARKRYMKLPREFGL